jgi:hypothetical protein
LEDALAGKLIVEGLSRFIFDVEHIVLEKVYCSFGHLLTHLKDLVVAQFEEYRSKVLVHGLGGGD